VLINNFSKQGFIVIKDAVDHKFLIKLQNTIINDTKMVKKRTKKINNSLFLKIIKNVKNQNLFDFIHPINKKIFSAELINELLKQKKIISCLVNLLGRDLAVSGNSSLTINLPKKENNYYFKDWHQEIWSGSSPSHVQLWSPIFQSSSNTGQIEFIKDSHTWGHVPHQNRRPISLPKNFKTIKTNISDRDLLVFSTLLLHRTVETQFPRMGIAMTVKNYKYKDMSFSDNHDWKIFSHSEITKIQRVLGNHYLSPFRLIGQEKKFKNI
jgi:ectoine hydroxylase-related dioxygenase (phytanoyl-CoA dioxygenase family)